MAVALLVLAPEDEVSKEDVVVDVVPFPSSKLDHGVRFADARWYMVHNSRIYCIVK